MGLAAFLDDPVTGYSFEEFRARGARFLPRYSRRGGNETYPLNLVPYGLAFVVFESEGGSRVTLQAWTMVSSRLVLGGTRTEVVGSSSFGRSVSTSTLHRGCSCSRRLGPPSSVNASLQRQDPGLQSAFTSETRAPGRPCFIVMRHFWACRAALSSLFRPVGLSRRPARPSKRPTSRMNLALPTHP